MLRKLITLLAAPMVVGAQQMTDTTFHPITSAEAVRLAKSNNVSAIQAANATRTAVNAVRAAQAQLYPTLTATAGQSKSAGQRLGQSGQPVDYTSSWTYSTGLSTGFTLFDGGKTFADVRARRADVASQEANETTTAYSLALQVKTQYNSILAANEQYAAGQAQLALAQQQLAVSIAKVNAGAANVSDSLRSVVTVGTAQLAILNAQQSLVTASAALTRLVGTPYLVTAMPADTGDHRSAPLDSIALLQMALGGPVIKQSQAAVNSSDASIRSAKAAYLPSISVSMSLGGNGTGTYGLNSDPFPYNRSVGLNLNYPLFNRFSRENQVASAQISLANAEATLRDQRLAAQQTIITQLGLMRNAEAQVLVQQTSVRASEEDLRVNQQRYQLGAGTLLDVLTSESSLITARQQLIQARLNYRNARAQIEAVIGKDLP